MSLINFTNLDFDQIKVQLREFLRSNSKFTDYDFEGSNLSTIIDVLSYNTYISSYNANMISNEVFLDSSTLRENVVSLARNIGYVPRSRRASRAVISFFVDLTELKSNIPVSLTLKSGLVCTSGIPSTLEVITFVIPKDITVTVNDGIASFDNVTVYEGTYITDTFTVDESTSQKYVIENINADTSLISVNVRENINSSTLQKFSLAENIFNVDSESKIFFIQEIEDQKYELIFGDGIFGKKLENFNVVDISYVVTNGEIANAISNFSYNGRIVDNNNNVIIDGISLITTNLSSRSGQEIESVASIKKYAPKFYASQNRAVTASDYETLIPMIYPETESVSAFGGEELNPPQYGKVFITIKPFFGPYVPNSIKDNLKRSLRKYSVAGIVPEILDLKYLYVEFDTSVYYNTNFASGSNFVRSIINNNLIQYSKSPELNKYGSRFKYSKFQKIIDDSHESVTSNITKISIRRDLRPKLNQFAEYEICFGNSFHIKNPNGFNIKTSGFTVPGTLDTVYFSDFPNTNSATGSIFLFKLNSKKDAVILRRNVGTIDYVKGEIKLVPTKFISTSKNILGEPIIEISVVPKSNDIIGLQNLYLQLDISKSKINMNNDDISSGLDMSGTSYITTSSYSNEELTR